MSAAIAKIDTSRADLDRLADLAEDVVRRCRSAGASAAEVGASIDTGLSVSVRLGDTETIEHTRDRSFGVTVYFGQRKGSASTADLAPDSIAKTIEQACAIARYTEADPAAGLADAALMARLERVAAGFAAAQVKVQVSADVMRELWTKLMVNCAYNALSALVQRPYGPIAAQPLVRALQHDIVREVVAVAAAEGVTLPLAESLAAMEHIAAAMPAQLSSTAQDLARGKPSEIDHLNGHVARRGEALGVPAPINRTLHVLVKLAESMRAG